MHGELQEAQRNEEVANQRLQSQRAVRIDDGIERRLDPDQEGIAVTYQEFRRFLLTDVSNRREPIPLEEAIVEEWEELTIASAGTAPPPPPQPYSNYGVCLLYTSPSPRDS